MGLFRRALVKLLGKVVGASLTGAYSAIGIASGFGYEVFMKESGRYWYSVTIAFLLAFIASLIPGASRSPAQPANQRDVEPE